MNIRDGRNVRFWTDIRHPQGRSIELAGEIGTQKLGIPREAKVCEVLRDGVWHFCNCRDQRIREVTQIVTTFPLSLYVLEPDSVSWKWGEAEFKETFVTSATWHQLHGRKEESSELAINSFLPTVFSKYLLPTPVDEILRLLFPIHRDASHAILGITEREERWRISSDYGGQNKMNVCVWQRQSLEKAKLICASFCFQ
ncbi:hypothetical protein Bca4012_062083 [Brassica carinata]